MHKDGSVPEERLKKACCYDSQEKKEYSRLFQHLLQHDNHRSEESEEIEI